MLQLNKSFALKYFEVIILINFVKVAFDVLDGSLRPSFKIRELQLSVNLGLEPILIFGDYSREGS